MSSTCALVCAGVKERVDADHLARAAVLGEADQHAGMGGAGDGADHDVVEGEAEFLFLRAHLFGEADIAEPAIFVHGGAGRDRIGLAALGLHVRDRLFPALANADVETFIDQLRRRRP